MSDQLDLRALARALNTLVGTDAWVFVWGKDHNEPEGDIFIGSPEFAALLADEYQREEAK